MDEYTGIRNFASRFLMFTEEEWKLLTSIITRRFIKKGEYILRGGEVCNHVTFINKGFMRVYNVVHDEELTINFAFEGNFITDFASLISRQPTTDYIIAMDDAEILQMSYQDLQKTYEKSHVWERFGRLMAEYILLFVVSRNKACFQLPEERYLKLIKERPKQGQRALEIHSLPGHYTEALSRIRKRLRMASNRKSSKGNNRCTHKHYFRFLIMNSRFVFPDNAFLCRCLFVKTHNKPFKTGGGHHQYADNPRIKTYGFRLQFGEANNLRVEVKSYPSVQELLMALENEEVDVAFMNTFGYLMLKEKSQAYEAGVVLNIPKEKENAYKSVIATGANISENTLEQVVANASDFVLVLVNPGSTSGNLVPRLKLASMQPGYPERFFLEVQYTNNHALAVARALKGEVALCAFGSAEYYKLGADTVKLKS